MRFRSWNLQLRLAAIACGLAVAAAGVIIVALQWRSGETIERLRLAQLQAADDDEVAKLLRAWADDEDVAFFVARLADERAAVAMTAGDVLHERLTKWQQLRSADSSPLVAALGNHLATVAEDRSPVGRSVASSLAQRILLWPLDEQTVDADSLLANCQRVLRAAALGRERDLLLAVAIDQPPGDAAMMVARHQERSPDVTNAEVAQSLPGGGLPVEAIELPATEPSIETPDSASPAEEPPSSFETPGEIYAPLATPLDLLDGKHQADDRTALQDSGDVNALRRIDAEAYSDERPLQMADEWSLMKLLQFAAEAPAAEAELRRRGHNARTLALARKVTDADPRVRAELADKLPQLNGIDPQSWLLQLSRDADSEVRRTAITVLASSDHPSITRWLEERRDGEADPRVAATIDNLLRRRR